jgi:hypothetical protein
MIGQPIKEPIQMNLPLKEEEDKIKKGICGNNHTLVLTEKGFVYAWGNGEFGQTCQNVKREEDPAQINENIVDPSMRTDHLIPNKLSTRDVDNIFTGGNHSFLIVKKEQRNVLKAWGLNSFGQLGTGDKENTWIPKDVIFNDRDCSVLSATGGSDHSLALTENGKVYAWGRNDENQCGINNDEGTARDDLCFSTPQEINFFSQHNIITDIKSYSHFNYAYNIDNGNVYSWGMGESYVLGNKRDSNEKSPFQIPQTFFNNLKIRDISLGSQHVIVSLYDPVTGVKCPKFEFDIGTGEQMDICENERNSPSLKRKNERDDNDNIGEIQMKGSPSKVKEINNENKKEIPVDIEMKNENDNDNKNEDKEKEVEEINEENQKDITPVKKSNNKEPKQKSINKKTPIKSRAQSAAKKQTTEKKVTNKKTSAKKTESRRTTNKKSSKHENRQNEEESDDEDEKEEKVKRSVSKRSNSKPKSSNKKYKKDDNDDNEKKTQRNKSKTNMRVVKPRKQKEIVSESESENESEEEEKPKKREYKKRRNIKSKPKIKTTSKRGKTTSNTKNSKRTKSKKQEEKTSIRKHSKSAKKTTANKKARSKSSKKK